MTIDTEEPPPPVPTYRLPYYSLNKQGVDHMYYLMNGRVRAFQSVPRVCMNSTLGSIICEATQMGGRITVFCNHRMLAWYVYALCEYYGLPNTRARFDADGTFLFTFGAGGQFRFLNAYPIDSPSAAARQLITELGNTTDTILADFHIAAQSWFGALFETTQCDFFLYGDRCAPLVQEEDASVRSAGGWWRVTSFERWPEFAQL